MKWVTRERPKIDRIACPWLIARFIDSAPEFLYVPGDQVLKVAAETGAIPYDIPDVEYSHHGDRCSFDAFIAKHGLTDPALHRLALVVRGADTGRLDLAPEVAGLLAVSKGLSLNFADDHVMLKHGMVVYDALYAWCADTPLKNMARLMGLGSIIRKGRAAMSTSPLLDVRGLTKRYGGWTALAGVDFDLAPGEILGVIGPNGAGKTTLMECLAGLLPADDGEVVFEGSPLPPATRREAMFYLPDGITPWSDQPVWRVTGLFRELFGQPRQTEATVIRQLELVPVLSKRVTELSKGYRRRLLLALALTTPQPILILDEPFDGFDLRQTLQVMALLREVAAERALILSIHQLKDAERICDRLLLLDAGRRLGLGTLAELAALTQLAGGDKPDLEEVFLGLTA